MQPPSSIGHKLLYLWYLYTPLDECVVQMYSYGVCVLALFYHPQPQRCQTDLEFKKTNKQKNQNTIQYTFITYKCKKDKIWVFKHPQL